MGTRASGIASGAPVLVTGAAGFIGGHLCRRLSAAGHEVHGVSRQRREPGGGVDHWWSADLADPASAGRILAGAQPEVVFHLAGHVFGSRELELVRPTFQANLVSTVHLLIAAAERGGSRLVLSGSMDEPRSVDEPLSSPYAVAKVAASTYARFFHDLYGLPVTIARIFMVYGPDQKDDLKLVPYVTRCLLRGETPKLASGGRSVDWIYVEDVVDALLEIGGRPNLAGRVIDVGTGVATSVRTVVETLRSIVGCDVEPSFGSVAERPRETEPVADVESTAATLGWRHRIDLRTGLRATVDWYRGNGAPDS